MKWAPGLQAQKQQQQQQQQCELIYSNHNGS
jgi:hypothetical protein